MLGNLPGRRRHYRAACRSLWRTSFDRNDANLAGLPKLAPLKPRRTTFCMTIGTGIGSALLPAATLTPILRTAKLAT